MTTAFNSPPQVVRKSDTPTVSGSTCMSNLTLTTASQLYDIPSEAFPITQTCSQSQPTSLSSLVRRKPLPPTASHLATKCSPGEPPVPKIDLPLQVPAFRPLTSDVSTSNGDFSLPWESAGLSLAR